MADKKKNLIVSYNTKGKDFSKVKKITSQTDYVFTDVNTRLKAHERGLNLGQYQERKAFFTNDYLVNERIQEQKNRISNPKALEEFCNLTAEQQYNYGGFTNFLKDRQQKMFQEQQRQYQEKLTQQIKAQIEAKNGGENNQ